ncbi:NAD(P)/FAD-dependent oxidoreductase [Pseudomonas silesiensis]|uniref:NAD(P)/FAD-dependent oxidoreductase n=1 Tax=Pseudomonas silesiensis TaxID=1853130 RepID=UPI0034D4A800
MEREFMVFDVLMGGGGPAGLAAAIRVKQLAAKNNHDVSVCLIEKGAEIGAHILSGAVMDSRALTELFPDWKERGAPLHTGVTADRVVFLSESGATTIPNNLLPECFINHGNYIAHLGNVVRRLGERSLCNAKANRPTSPTLSSSCSARRPTGQLLAVDGGATIV